MKRKGAGQNEGEATKLRDDACMGWKKYVKRHIKYGEVLARADRLN